MSEIKISLVPSEGAVALWPKIRSYMQKSADYTYGRYEVDDILVSITDYDYNLWIAFNDNEVLGAVVTSFRMYPRKKYLDLTFIGGKPGTGRSWKDSMLETLQYWAFDNNCDGIESSGRPGWARAMKQDGYKFLWQTYELPSADRGLEVVNG